MQWKPPSYKSKIAKLPNWQEHVKKMNDTPEFDARKLMQKYQGPFGKAQGFWGKLAPKMSPISTRKGQK